MNKKFLMAAAGMAAMLAATPAFAQASANANISVFLIIPPSCVISGGGGGLGSAILDFGTVTNSATFPTDLDGATNVGGGTPISVVCNTSSTTAAFEVDNGLNDSGGFHRLSQSTTSTAPFVKYKVYSSPARTPASEYIVGQKQTIGTGVYTAGVPLIVNVYGRILKADINAAATILFPGGGFDGYTDGLRATFTL